jgi:hypothetical protein
MFTRLYLWRKIDLNLICKQSLLQSFIWINSISCCAHIANSMDSSKSCMTGEHRLEWQQDECVNNMQMNLLSNKKVD